MAMTLAELQVRNTELKQQNQLLMDEHLAFKRKIKKLSWANYYKWLVLVASVGVGGVSLWISIWSLVDGDRDGLAETGVALSSVSLVLSSMGLFDDCGCLSRKKRSNEDDSSNSPNIENTVAIV